jgi:hypothetical protein
MDQDDAFRRVIERVLPLIYAHLREDAHPPGARVERFVTHDRYQRARGDLVQMLEALQADTLVTEYVLSRVLPHHQPPLH